MAFEQLAPDRVPSSWTKWLDRGWHSIGVGDWLDGYVLPKLEADLLFLRQLVQSRGDFSRMNQRLEREVVGDLLRAQTHPHGPIRREHSSLSKHWATNMVCEWSESMRCRCHRSSRWC